MIYKKVYFLNLAKGFLAKKDTSEVPNVPPLTPELMNVFEKDKPRRDNNSENSQCSGDVNSIGDKLKNVSHINEGVHYNSKQLYINNLTCECFLSLSTLTLSLAFEHFPVIVF